MNRFLRSTLLAAATAAAFGVSGLALAQDGQLKTEKDKVSYLVGMQVGCSLAQINDEIDLAVVLKAMESTIKGEKPLMTQEQAMEVQKGFAERVVKWDQDTNISRRMSVNHFFGAKKA